MRNFVSITLLTLLCTFASFQLWSQETPAAPDTNHGEVADPGSVPCTSSGNTASILSPMSKAERTKLEKTYMPAVIKETYKNWLPIIPAAARPPASLKGCVAISFSIARSGKASLLKLDHPSGDVALDRAAWGGITGSTYLPLPDDYPHDQLLRLRFSFFYNEKPGRSQGTSIQKP